MTRARGKGGGEPAAGAGGHTLPIQDTGRALPRQFELRVQGGPDAGREFSSRGERTVIGTHESADFVLTDATVSRFHCEITSTGGAVLVRDLESRNGTVVDGVNVLHAHLRSGSALTVGRSQLRLEVRAERVDVPQSTRETFGTMVGKSTAMRRAFALLERAAANDSTVLLDGETGTGKEAAAESIHRESARSGGPFIVVDCGAIPADLLESELFGHERGSFTGAVAARPGAFEAAEGGTVFLDEIGELALALQPKLLRVLERREVKRVGQSKHVKVDVRIIAATNRDLYAEINTQRFRSDLYYRLAVLGVRLPPLRERGDDLPMLVEHLLDSLGAAARPEAELLRTPDFLADLARHSWPGNVRELRNYLERCLALHERAPLGHEGAAAGPAPAAAEVDLGQPLKEARQRCVRELEERYVVALMQRHGDNVAAAARAAGIDRITLYRLLWRCGLR